MVNSQLHGNQHLDRFARHWHEQLIFVSSALLLQISLLLCLIITRMLEIVQRRFSSRVFLQCHELLTSLNVISFNIDFFCAYFASPPPLCNQNAFFSSSSSNGIGGPYPSPNPNPIIGALFTKKNDLGYQHDYSAPQGEPIHRADCLHESEETCEVFEGSAQTQSSSYRSSASNFGEMYGFDDGSESGEESDNADAIDGNEFDVLDLFRGNAHRREPCGEFHEERDESKHPLVKEICRLIGLRHAWNPKLERELRSLLRSLKPPQVSAVLRSQADVRLAVSLFHWADRQWRYRHSHEVYYTMLEILSRTKLSQASRRILRLMIRRGIARRPEAFGYVMVSYSRAAKLRSAMRVLNLMQKDGCSPDLAICNIAIHVLVMANRLEKALQFLNRMQGVGIDPDVVTFNCLIKGFCHVHRVEDALEMMREMPFKGCPPDKISYYTVISFLCKEKRVEEVRELLEKMKNDSNLIPDQVTHNLLIHVLSKHGHSDEALGFLREAVEKGFRVDKVGYSAIIHSFCRDGRMDEAKEIVKEMLSKDCLPDVVTYTSVVNGFCRIGKIDQARKLMDYMYNKGCKPNAVTYTALLNGLCRIGSSSEAKEMLNKSEEEWWTPNAITYSVVVHGLRREGKFVEACDLAMQMIQNGFFPTPVEINQLIHALCRDGKPMDSKKFMEDCQSKGCAVSVVNFTTIIHGFCQAGDLVSALSLLDDMYLSNRHPDVVTYTVLIDALGKKDRFEEASELVKKMLNRGLIPTPVTYRAVIHRFCERGSVDDLLKLLDKMLARKEFRTAYNQVIEKLCGFGRLDEAYKVIGKVLRTASKIDADTCYILMDCFLKRSLPLLSYKVACRMFRRNLIPNVKLCQKVCNRLVSAGKSDEAGRLMTKFIERGQPLA